MTKFQLMQVIGRQIRADTGGHWRAALNLELPLLRQELHSRVLCLAQLVPTWDLMPLLPRWRFDASRLQIRCKSSGGLMQPAPDSCAIPALPSPVWTGPAPSCQIRTLSHGQFQIKQRGQFEIKTLSRGYLQIRSSLDGYFRQGPFHARLSNPPTPHASRC